MRMSPPARLSRVFLDVADTVEGAEEDDEGTYGGRRGCAGESMGKIDVKLESRDNIEI